MPRSTAASAEEEDEGIQLLINPSHQLIPFRSKSPRPCISLHRAALQENDQRCANRNHQSAIKSARSELDDVKTGREKIWCNPDQSFQSRNSYAQRSCAVPRPFFFCVCLLRETVAGLLNCDAPLYPVIITRNLSSIHRFKGISARFKSNQDLLGKERSRWSKTSGIYERYCFDSWNKKERLPLIFCSILSAYLLQKAVETKIGKSNRNLRYGFNVDWDSRFLFCPFPPLKVKPDFPYIHMARSVKKILTRKLSVWDAHLSQFSR